MECGCRSGWGGGRGRWSGAAPVSLCVLGMPVGQKVPCLYKHSGFWFGPDHCVNCVGRGGANTTHGRRGGANITGLLSHVLCCHCKGMSWDAHSQVVSCAGPVVHLSV